MISSGVFQGLGSYLIILGFFKKNGKRLVMPSSLNSEFLGLAEDVCVGGRQITESQNGSSRNHRITSFHVRDFCIIAVSEKLTLPE